MKKRNINYGSLKERGIKKAWDKACVYARADRENEFQIVLFYSGKPFIDWPTNDPFNVEKIRIKISTAIEYHGNVSQSSRRIDKRLARYFLRNEAGEKLVTYRNGGVLFPKGV